MEWLLLSVAVVEEQQVKITRLLVVVVAVLGIRDQVVRVLLGKVLRVAPV
jgi:hypothetical protein